MKYQIRAAIVCKYASPPGRGVLTRIYYMSQYLCKQGVHVDLYISNSNHLGNLKEKHYCDPDLPNLHVTQVKSINYARGGKFLRILSWLIFDLQVFFLLLVKSKRDLYLASSPSLFSGFFTSIVAKIKKSKFVFDVRDPWPDVLIQEVGMKENSFAIRLMKKIESFTLKRSDLITSSLPNIAKYIEDKSFNTKSIVFPICIEEFNLKRSVEVKYHKPNKPVVIGYAGSLGSTNNLDSFFQYISENALENFQFKIIGSGALKSQYIEMSQHRNNIKFLEPVPKQEMHDFFSKIDLFYISTHNSQLWEYGQSLNKLVDAMYFGKPIILAYPSHGFMTMVNEASCGWFLEPNNKKELHDVLAEIRNNPSELGYMGARAHQWIMKFRNYDKLYPSLTCQMLQSLGLSTK